MTTVIDAENRSPLAHVAQVTRDSKTSFFKAMDRLGEPKRSAMFAIYAFCREVDDIADGHADVASKRQDLASWRAEIDALYAGTPRYLTARALLDPVQRFDLQKQDFLAVIEGMERDCEPVVRIQDRADLEAYCDRVACAVGRLSNRVFGAPAAHADEVAFALGQALQLTNILRDIAEDAKRDRLYLPASDLAEQGLPTDPAIPATQVVDRPLQPVCQPLARLAEQRFDQAELALAECDRETMLPAHMMKAGYQMILNKMIRQGWDQLDQRVSLSGFEKVKLALKFGLG